MKDNMKKYVKKASKQQTTILGFNIFGYEDAVAVLEAAQKLNQPVMLMVNKLAASHMPIEYLGKSLSVLANMYSIPVGIHLDHCNNHKIILDAIKHGFTSVMYDGSQLSLEENIKNTKYIVNIAKEYDVSVEGEIGSVPYADTEDGYKDIMTSPHEAKVFAKESGVDWVAVAVGQIHRLQRASMPIQFDRVAEIVKFVDIPLVIHGCSGIKHEDIRKLCNYNIGKMNFGTALRMVFGQSLQKQVKENPEEFDRIKMFFHPMKEVEKEVTNIYKRINYDLKNNI